MVNQPRPKRRKLSRTSKDVSSNQNGDDHDGFGSDSSEEVEHRSRVNNVLEDGSMSNESSEDEELEEPEREENKNETKVNAGDKCGDTDSDDERQFTILDEDVDCGTNQSDEDDTELTDDDLQKLCEEFNIGLDQVKSLHTDQNVIPCGQYQLTAKEKIDFSGFMSEHWEELPEDWEQVEHDSGIPIYIHKSSGVASATRPYNLGPGSIKKHKICMNGVPCLNYEKASDPMYYERNEPEKSSETNVVEATSSCDNTRPSGTFTYKPHFPNNHASSVRKNEKNFIDSVESVKYCKKLFRFKTIKIRRFYSWKMKRVYVHKQRCQNKRAHKRPDAPKDTLVVSVPTYKDQSRTMVTQKWSLNPNGKSSVCILHEYLQRAVKTHPVYEYKELENAKTPYYATIKLNGMIYGNGMGSSKKLAKLEAAKSTLEILIPELKEIWSKTDAPSSTTANLCDEDKYTLFDKVKTDDPSVGRYCETLSEVSPYDMLVACIEINFGLDETSIEHSSVPTEDDKVLFKISAGGHSASVVCKDKVKAKQLACQKLLQKLHPQVIYFGSLLRLYGNAALNNIKNKKVQEQGKKEENKINPISMNVLGELKSAMKEIYADRQYLLEKGNYVPDPTLENVEDEIEQFGENGTEQDVENRTEPDVENRTEPDVENRTEPDVENRTEPDVENRTEPDVEYVVDENVSNESGANVDNGSEDLGKEVGDSVGNATVE